MKDNMKTQAIAAIVCGALLAGIAIVMLVVGIFFPEDESMTVAFVMIAVLFLLGAGVLAIMAYVNFARLKKRQQNLDDPTTLAHKLYCKGSEYDFYQAYPVASGEVAKNVAMNAVGLLAFATVGVGVFGWSKKAAWEIFVTKEEIVINNNNQKCEDDKFIRIPASVIENVQFESKKGQERTTITFNDGSDVLVFDVLEINQTAEDIHISFLKPMRERLAGKSETAQTEQAVYGEFEEKEQSDNAEAPTENSENSEE